MLCCTDSRRESTSAHMPYYLQICLNHMPSGLNLSLGFGGFINHTDKQSGQQVYFVSIWSDMTRVKKHQLPLGEQFSSFAQAHLSTCCIRVTDIIYGNYFLSGGKGWIRGEGNSFQFTCQRDEKVTVKSITNKRGDFKNTMCGRAPYSWKTQQDRNIGVVSAERQFIPAHKTNLHCFK